MKLMPASIALSMIATPSSCGVRPPNIIAPRQSSDTLTPVRPRGRYFTNGSFSYLRQVYGGVCVPAVARATIAGDAGLWHDAAAAAIRGACLIRDGCRRLVVDHD